VVLVRQGTSNLEAYNLRLKARRWLFAPDPKTSGTAVKQLREAIALDPRYSDAWGDLAYVLAYMSTWTGEPVPLDMEAYAAATVALTQAPENVTGLLCKGYLAIVMQHDAASSASYYERARAAGVDLSLWAFQKAYLHHGPLGQYDEAIAALREAERMDPLAPNLKHALIEMYLASGQVAAAVSTAEAAERLPAKGPEVIAMCGLVYLSTGDVRRTREALERIGALGRVESAPGIPLRLALDAATGDLEDANGLLDSLLKQYADGHMVSAYLVGEAYKTLGDYDKAFEWWTRSIERYEGWAFSVMAVRNRNHPVIGKDPRFRALLRRMGLERAGETTAAGQ
jgi:tetratricopeptide (TPR) repeat protein